MKESIQYHICLNCGRDGGPGKLPQDTGWYCCEGCRVEHHAYKNFLEALGRYVINNYLWYRETDSRNAHTKLCILLPVDVDLSSLGQTVNVLSKVIKENGAE